MLLLDIVEGLVLIEIIFFDVPRAGFSFEFGVLELYFAASMVSVLIQIAGIVLVMRGWYRVGAIFQIVSSSPHVIKGEGLIGIVGGIKAYKYPELALTGKPSGLPDPKNISDPTDPEAR